MTPHAKSIEIHYTFWQTWDVKTSPHTVDGSETLHQLIGGLSHDLQSIYTCQVVGLGIASAKQYGLFDSIGIPSCQI